MTILQPMFSSILLISTQSNEAIDFHNYIFKLIIIALLVRGWVGFIVKNNQQDESFLYFYIFDIIEVKKKNNNKYNRYQ